jgi:hypothetical protein
MPSLHGQGSLTAPNDAMKRRGYIIYAGLTPRDMEGVVVAFAASFAELRGT